MALTPLTQVHFFVEGSNSQVVQVAIVADELNPSRRRARNAEDHRASLTRLRRPREVSGSRGPIVPYVPFVKLRPIHVHCFAAVSAPRGR